MNKITKKVGAAILSASFFISAIFSLSACSGDDKNGEAGADGLTPFIGENGNWWIGEVDTGVYAGGKNGQNGTDGKDGKDGADAIAPKFLYNEEDGYLHISYDDGETWVRLVNISNIVSDGKDGTSITSCLINESGELVITYSDGNSENLGTIVAKDGKDGVDGKDGKDGTDGKDGVDGKDGANGKDGTDGKDGKDGADGVGIANIGLDNAGNLTVILSDGTVLPLGNIKGADGVDGINGQDGTNGKDGATPLVQINAITKVWEVSYDNGATWDTLGIVSVGPAGENGVTPIVRIHNGYWEVSYDNGSSWRSTDIKAEGTDGAPGEDGVDGRGIAKLEIIDNCLWVTYTDSTTPVNLGKLTAEASGGSGTVEKDVYTDALDFYPNIDGESYSVKIGNAIYMKEIVIPSTYNGKPVTGILPFGFAGEEYVNVYLETVIIPDSIVVIGEHAFENCPNLNYIFVPASVRVIGEMTFLDIEIVQFEISEAEAPEEPKWNEEYFGCILVEWKKDENVK